MVASPEVQVVGAAADSRAPAVALLARTRSFDEIYDEHVDFVWRSARRLGVDDGTVDDVTQQVFLVVHRRLAEFSGHPSMKAWVFAILVRVVREYRRTRRRKSPHSFAPAVDPETIADSRQQGPHDSLARIEAARMVQQWLEELDDEKREVFVLSELEQLTAGEIAQVTGVNVSTVYSRLRAARQDFERAAERYRKRDTWRL